MTKRFTHEEIEDMLKAGCINTKADGLTLPVVIFNSFKPDDPTDKLLNASVDIIKQLLKENTALHETITSLLRLLDIRNGI